MILRIVVSGLMLVTSLLISAAEIRKDEKQASKIPYYKVALINFVHPIYVPKKHFDSQMERDYPYRGQKHVFGYCPQENQFNHIASVVFYPAQGKNDVPSEDKSDYTIRVKWYAPVGMELEQECLNDMQAALRFIQDNASKKYTEWDNNPQAFVWKR